MRWGYEIRYSTEYINDSKAFGEYTPRCFFILKKTFVDMANA